MIEKEERRWVWGFSLVVVLITTLPYLLGYLWSGDDWLFTGHLFGVEDGNSYVAQMLLGARGDWLFRSPYTEMQQRGAVVLLPYILLGKLTAPPGQYQQMLALYHLLRIAGSIGIVWATYSLLSIWIQDLRLRRFAVVLTVLGGGLGFLGLLWNQPDQPPLEFFSPEAFGFLMVLGIPHLTAARALILTGIREFLVPGAEPWKPRGWIRAGLPWLAAALFQPLPVLAGCSVIGFFLLGWAVWIFWKGRQNGGQEWQSWQSALQRAARVGLFSAPIVIYTILAFRNDPALRIWERQNTLFSPPVCEYLLSYSIILSFAIWGALRTWHSRPLLTLFSGCWVIGGLLMIYIPITTQRRLIEGAWIALVALACAGLEGASTNMRRWTERVLSLSFIAPLIFYSGTLLILREPQEPLYRRAAEIEMFRYIESNLPKDTVVLANREISSVLPAWAPVRVLMGHGPLSLDGPEVEAEAVSVLTGDRSEAERTAFFQSHQVGYLFWGPEEDAAGNWDPFASTNLTALYQQDGYAIFLVEEIE